MSTSGDWNCYIHFCPGGPGIAREVAKSKPELLNLMRGWGAAGVWDCGEGLGKELTQGSYIGEMSAFLVEGARCKGFQGSMGQQGSIY